MSSIKLRGLQEIPKYDKTLSAIKAGNGRVEALAQMEKNGYELPKGVAYEKKQITGYAPINWYRCQYFEEAVALCG